MSLSRKNIWIKFETKSNRVKGLAFHPKRPWILASLHDGVIQLWDYRMETMLEKYEEHEGPVRGINFHPSQPLFVSGGDDKKIKVWNYQRCLFTLPGHLDYIRTVQFHHEYPWILSASDDQVIRIWNWQSRQVLSVLTGHNHYVMCAQFHPTSDLIVSASLDQTVRVWDFSGLRKRSVSIAGEYGSSGDLFGATDVSVKYLLDGHTRGVNWAAFHPTLNLIVSAADDREVRLWRVNEYIEVKSWDVDVFRGHTNNVSCVVFHPKKELIISNSEDKTIRVWDFSKNAPHYSQHQVFRRDNDRYWVLDVHPTQNLIAGGHDSGLLIFKLYRERPAMDSYKRKALYYHNQYVYEVDLKDDGSNSSPKAIFTTRSAAEGRRGDALGVATGPPKYLSYNFHNRSQHCVLLAWDQDNVYELYVFNSGEVGRDSSPTAMRGFGKCAVFVSKNRFAVIDRLRSIVIRDLKNNFKSRVTVPGNPSISQIFSGGLGRLLLRAPSSMILYDIQANRVVAELPIQSRHPVKYAYWSPDSKYLALVTKNQIFITDSKLHEKGSIMETSRIKSGCWDTHGVFVFATTTHLKYILFNGDSGVIRTLDKAIYISGVADSVLYYLDREPSAGKMLIDATEYLFKVAVHNKNSKEVTRIIGTKKLMGEAIIAYLQKKGFPEVALQFVQDDRIKFGLALECGNIAIALECAQRLNNQECWHKLGVEALRQGNHQIVESAYQKTRNFERLSLFYLITGSLAKLGKMLKISCERQDVMARFHNALYLGDVEQRVAVLRDAGQYGLALLTAKVHGLTALADEIETQHKDKLPEHMPEVPEDSRLLFPPAPILKASPWPLLDLGKDWWAAAEAMPQVEVKEDEEPKPKEPEEDEEKGDWEPVVSDSKKKEEPKEAKEKEEGGGWGDDGLDIPVEEEKIEEAGAEHDDYIAPTRGKTTSDKWTSSSTIAADLAAAGDFKMAMHLLNRQLGVINFEPLKKHFLTLFESSQTFLPILAASSSLPIAVSRSVEGKEALSLPAIALQLENAVEELKLADKAFTEGKFKTALQHFNDILFTLPLIVLNKKSQVQEVHELIGVCRQYITALRLETARKESTDPLRQAALSAYFTQCKIQPIHLILGLRIAIKSWYQINNFKTTANLCRRMLEFITGPGNYPADIVTPQLVKQIKGVLKTSEAKNEDKSPIDYDESKAFEICSGSLTPIYRGQPSVDCPYCKSVYKPTYDGQVCKTCQLSKIGSQATGLHLLLE